MKLKKILSILLLLMIVFAAEFPMLAQNFGFSFGRITVTMPEITVEIEGSGYDVSEVSATLNNEMLNVDEIVKYDSNVHSTRAFILVDISGSMASSFELVKRSIISFIEKMSDKDALVLLTFGQSNVEIVLSGDEDRAEAIALVNDLSSNERGTLFYEALGKAYQMSASSVEHYDREYAIVFSDGIDVQLGNTTYDEVMNKYKSHLLPLYAACTANASKDSAARFGEIARASGGKLAVIRSDNDFTTLVDTVNNVSLLKLIAQSNRADGSERLLSVRIGNSQTDCMVHILQSIPDVTPPSIEDCYFDVDKDCFIIAFSEKVLNADVAGSYKVMDPNNRNVEVVSVFYQQSEDVYEIRLKDAVVNGDYTIEFSGIRDDSAEANPLVGVQKVTVSAIEDNTPPTVKELYYDQDRDLLIVAFSEDVIGADNAESYLITDSTGKQVEIIEVVYAENEDQYELKPSSAIYNGSYSIKFPGIFDCSKEANRMTQERTLNIRNASDRQEFPPWAILLVVLGVLLLIGFIVVLIRYSEKHITKTQTAANHANATLSAEAIGKEGGAMIVSANSTDEKVHLSNDVVRIGLNIKTASNAAHMVNISILSSIIVGRSEICDVCIDDSKLSRQHFAIENENGSIYIMDLQSSNGTMLNGIRIKSRRRLNCGDKIIAGLSDISITQIGR